MDGMDARDWDRLYQNRKDLREQKLDKLELMNHLYEKFVISQDDRREVETCKPTTYTNQMNTLLEILKKKPLRLKAYQHFIDGLRTDTPWLADQIEKTETTADPSLKSVADSSLIEQEISEVLSKLYTPKNGESVYLSEVKETLKQNGVDTIAACYSDEKLIQLIHNAFTRVEEITRSKRIGRRLIADVRFKNVGLKKSSKGSTTGEIDNKGKDAEDIQYKIDCTTDEVKKFKTDELMKFIEKHLLANHLETGCLEVLRAELITGRSFLLETSESLKGLLEGFPVNLINCLSDLITHVKNTEQYSKKPLETQILRKFGSNNSNKTYSTKRKLPVTRNINGPLTQPIRNFHLVEEQELDDALEFIASEFIPFVSACLNERRDGTIYFGVSPTDSDKYQAGEIVGVQLPQKDHLKEKIDIFCERSFSDSQRQRISQMLRNVCCVPVVDSDLSDLFVVEIDVIISSKLLNEDTFYTKLDYIPIHYEICKQPSGIFRFYDGIPKICTQVEEIINYERNDKLKIINQRLQDEKKNDVIKTNLGVKLQNLLGSGNIENSFIFLLTSPGEPASTQDDISSEVSFIRTVEPRCVFDFETRPDGVFKKLDNLKEDFIRVLTLDNFKTNEDANLGRGEIAWIFCNGYDTSPAQETKVWKMKRRNNLQQTLDVFQRLYPENRVIVIVCLFSENYDTLFEGCDEVFKRYQKKWILLAENEDLAKRFLDRAKVRELADTDDVYERCVIGLSWEEVDETLLSTRPKRNNVPMCIPCSSGGSVKVAELQLKRWSDLNILTSGELSSTESEDELHEKNEEVKKRFYRGDEVDWWNFHFGHHVERQIHGNLKVRVREALSNQDGLEENLITWVNIHHQHGAGGTTAAKHILWEFRNEWRCCVLNTISEQTADQLLELREFKDKTPKPVLVLIDNQNDDMTEDLIAIIKQKLENRNKFSYPVFFTLLRCVRIMDAPISGSHVSLSHKLTDKELQSFDEKFELLEKDYRTKKSNVAPSSLLSFNIMKNNFKKEYIERVVKEFTKSITDETEMKLLKLVSFISTYYSNPVPVFCFDKLLLQQPEKSLATAGFPPSFVRKPHWETRLSDEVHVLLNIRLNRGWDRIAALRIFNRMVASQVLFLMRERTGQKESEILLELLSSVEVFCFKNPDPLYTVIKSILHNREKLSGNRQQKFSQFVENIRQSEGPEKTVEVLSALYQYNGDAFTAQLLARFFLDIGEWNKAEFYANKAVERCPKNSFLRDTLGQVFFNQIPKDVQDVNDDTTLMKKVQDIILISYNAHRTFLDGQRVSKVEASHKHKARNLACHFGELKAIENLLEALSKYLDESTIHEYLVYPDKQVEILSFLKDHEKRFLKSLDQRYQKLMRRLSEELLHSEESLCITEPSFQQKKLVKLKVNLKKYFEEKSDSVPANLNKTLKCEYRMRLVRDLGATSVEAVLTLRNSNDKLMKIIELIENNLAGKSGTAYEYKLVLQASFVLMLGNSLPETKFKDVLGWSKELYTMESFQRDKIDLYPFFFFVIFNFPTQSREAFRLQYMSELSTALENWKMAAMKKCSSLRDNKRNYLNRVQYFLGSDSPPKDIVHFDDFKHILAMPDTSEKWKHPELRNILLPTKGMLLEGGNLVRIYLKNKEGGHVLIRTAHFVYDRSRWMKSVEFYVGFCLTGPKAYIIEFK
ncbi:sterile alpha motif domain-containing protein 9-like [Physella acuta]|uniref:sterile alpha motif domain-containing protein 9-like n=1 Tax=Physella acuta TaxID=109671 RepID=UPI0027DBFCFC|nr:sterile alpha motif domain-containing protein 9-like [Physella acuta]